MENTLLKKLTEKVLVAGLLLALEISPTLAINGTEFYQRSVNFTRSKETTTRPSKKETLDNTLIVLSPHFDDAVLSVGGLISDFNGPKYIVTFFSTPKVTTQFLTEWDKISGFRQSIDAKEVRENENNSAAILLGANVINKNYVDNQYETRSQKDICDIINFIAKDIELIIESNNNKQVTFVGPAYFGKNNTHPDHLLVSKAFIQVIRNNNYTNANFFFYEDLPYTYKRFGTHEITLDKILTNFYNGIHLKKRELFISKEAFDSQLDAIRLYSSQIKAFDSLGEDIVKDITNFELNRCPQFPLPSRPFEVIYEIQK